MDAFAQLALMAKAKRVFESADTFLSFPALSPLSYSPDELRFGETADMTAKDLAESSEFARVANQLPRAVIAPLEADEYLWDVYRDVLDAAQIARGSMTTAERASYERAMSVLYTTDENGLRTDSERMRAYKQHRDAVLEAEEEFANQKLTAEASTDEEVVARWRNDEEPRLRRLVQERQDAWQATGFKAEVEAAQQLEAAGVAQSPATAWSEWRDAFIDDLDMLTDAQRGRFAVTGYSPTDVLGMDNWPRFTITRDEMIMLGQEAPAELREIYGAGTQPESIESVSFEYRSVAVLRPWFRPAVLKARFWRLPPDLEQLSDGADMASGRMPAYVAAMVLARNIEIKTRETPQPGRDGGMPTPLLQVDRASLSPSLARRIAGRSAIAVGRARTAPGPSPASAPAPETSMRAVSRLRTTAFATTLASASAPVRAPVRILPASGLRLRTLLTATDVRFAGRADIPAPAAEPESAASSDDPPEGGRAGEIVILAFICKRLGRSPDPDPSLAWD